MNKVVLVFISLFVLIFGHSLQETLAIDDSGKLSKKSKKFNKIKQEQEQDCFELKRERLCELRILLNMIDNKRKATVIDYFNEMSQTCRDLNKEGAIDFVKECMGCAEQLESQIAENRKSIELMKTSSCIIRILTEMSKYNPTATVEDCMRKTHEQCGGLVKEQN